MIIAGVDEAGRGPLAGPVTAAAVILDVKHPIAGLADSKVLSHKQRVVLADTIKQFATAWAIAEATVEEIEHYNIHYATLLAMKRAVEGLSVAPSRIEVDGKFCPQVSCEAQAFVDGDALIPAISAASILAKVHRDETMIMYHETYPHYGFDQHKGYATKLHQERLKLHGACVIHRKTFAIVKDNLVVGSYEQT